MNEPSVVIPSFTLVKNPDESLKKNLYNTVEELGSINLNTLKYLSSIFTNLVVFMKTNGGCGLAANQVKIGEGIIPEPWFIMDDGIRGPELFYLPVITRRYGKHVAKEGCLSCENDRLVPRYDEIEVEYINIDGERKRQRRKGLSARIIQHEVCHLLGITIEDE